MSIRRRVAVGAGAAGAIAALALFGVSQGGGIDVFVGSTPTPTATPTPPPDPVANVWVVSGGGACSRRSTQVAYADSATGTDSRCGSYDQAYEAMACGDLGLIRPGNYGNQAVAGSKGCSGATQVTLAAEVQGTTPFYRGDELGSVSAMTLDLGPTLDDVWFRYMTISETNSTCLRTAGPGGTYPGGCNNWKMVDMIATTNVDMDHVTIDRAWFSGDGLGLTRDNTDNDFTWSEAKNGVDNKMIQIQNFGGGSFAVNNLRMENFDCHDQGFSFTTYNVPADDPHGECLWMTGDSDGMQFINWRCWNSFSTGCINWGGVGGFGGPKLDVLFRNCLMGPSYTFTNGVDIAPGAPVAYRGDSNANAAIQGENTGGTGTFEYCVVDGSVDFDAWSSLTVRGSFIDSSGCSAGVTYAYTKYTSGSPCSGTGNTVSSGAFTTANFVSIGTNTTAGDYRPANSSAVQCGAGDPASFPAADFFGTARGNPPDAGLYEC